MSRIIHCINLGLRYGRSKGVREHRQEDGVIGNLAAPCHREESASHHSPSLASLRKQGKLCESLENHIVRQHNEIASATSIWGELAVSNHEKS